MDIGYADESSVGDILPALVLGWQGEGPGESWRLKRTAWDDGPPWFLRFGHQYMGYSCAHAELGGMVMGLRDQPATADVVASLEVLACGSPRDRAIRARPDLAPLHLQSTSYDSAQLAALNHVLASCPVLPPAIGGHEALVELDAHLGVERLEGWRVLAPELAPRTHHTDRDAADVVIGPIGPHARLDDRLVAAARQYGAPRPPRLFLLWFNSD